MSLKTTNSEYFYIVSEANPNMVLDIEGGNSNNGTKLIVWEFHGGENQQFKFDEHGFIKSRRSGLVMDVEGGVGQGRKIIQYQKHGGENQRWRLTQAGTIQLECAELVMDVEGGNVNPGTHVIAWPPHGGPNQRWRIANAWH
eukprot:m51a1_g6177 putative carbohydrate binding module (142) ;mRNA; r:27626-28171